jgi:Putative prokaryotic signal transducing protein
MSAGPPGRLDAEPPDELVCPSCGRRHPRQERFCADCGMPLVQGAGREQPASDRQRRARKIKPQYAEGQLVNVARAQNQSEAELIEGLLLEEGIPCMLRRSRGFDVPDMLVAGPRDVLVPASGAQAAREALAWQPPESGPAPAGSS